jgi:hypothetical protein
MTSLDAATSPFHRTEKALPALPAVIGCPAAVTTLAPRDPSPP